MKRKVKTPRKIGLVANLGKGPSREVVARAATLIALAGRIALADESTARLAKLGCRTFPDAASLAAEADLILVFGGDGTLLRVVREIHGSDTPILGINAGRLGFLTAVTAHDLPKALEKIWKGDFSIERRPLLEAIGHGQGKPLLMRAFNDIVISHGAVSKLIELDVYVDNNPVTRYRGDGLIVCSPAGSTAYSLSAGGPIISPDAQVFAITPICAHAVSHRSVLISSNSTVRVKLVSQRLETIIAADGQVEARLSANDAVEIRRSRRLVRWLHLGGSSFFGTVRQKLHWSGSAV